MPALLRTDDVAFHASMLRDEARTKAYRDALRAVVRPGDVVCEIGAGTGILSLFAMQAGARKVYAIERGPIAELARAIVRANGAEDVIEVIQAPSTEVVLPEPADVLVTETLWNIGLGEGIAEALADARRRLLKPEARIIPQGLEILIAPAVHERAYRRVDFWKHDVHGFDFRAMRETAANRVYSARLDPDDLLAPPQVIADVDLAEEGSVLRAHVEFEIARDVAVQGIGGFFRARLADAVSVSNLPGSEAWSWDHAFLPVDQPLELRAGARLNVDVWVAPGAEQWRWTLAAGGEVRKQSTFADPAVTLRQLRKFAPGNAPTLSGKGAALAEILASLDGSRTVEQLTEQVVTAYPEAFPSRDSAEAFVHEILERWT